MRRAVLAVLPASGTGFVGIAQDRFARRRAP